MKTADVNLWIPILDGELRERSLDKLKEIGEYLYQNCEDTPGYGLLSGKTGIALFFYYYYRLTADYRYLVRVEKLLNIAISEIDSEQIPYFSHCTGISGVAWCLDFLHEEDILPYGALSIFGEKIYNVVRNQAENYMSAGNYDFLHGGIGLLLYLFERGIGASDIVKQFIRRGVPDFNRLKWISADQTRKGHYCYNLSLAHGNPSILSLLAAVQTTRSIPEFREESISLANYILSCKHLTGLKHSSFPNFIPIPERSAYVDSRLAWCYGDLGIAYTLYRAGLLLGNTDLENEALSIFDKCLLRRKYAETFVVDACFCHGAVGIAHMYGKLFNHTGISRYKGASNFWYEKTLMFGNAKHGAAGFETWRAGGSEKVNSLLDGIAGIGLSLISAVSDLSPDWDKFMLLDLK